jgi:hypothetical protein
MKMKTKDTRENNIRKVMEKRDNEGKIREI